MDRLIKADNDIRFAIEPKLVVPKIILPNNSEKIMIQYMYVNQLFMKGDLADSLESDHVEFSYTYIINNDVVQQYYPLTEKGRDANYVNMVYIIHLLLRSQISNTNKNKLMMLFDSTNVLLSTSTLNKILSIIQKILLDENLLDFDN
jgi:hypothetical protein